MSGEAAVVRDGAIIKRYRAGDFFGETSLLTGNPRTADVRASSELVTLAIGKYDFLSFVRGTDLADALVRLAKGESVWSDETSVEAAWLGRKPDARPSVGCLANLESNRFAARVAARAL